MTCSSLRSYDTTTGVWSDARHAVAVHRAMGDDAPLLVEEDDEDSEDDEDDYAPIDGDLS